LASLSQIYEVKVRNSRAVHVRHSCTHGTQNMPSDAESTEASKETVGLSALIINCWYFILFQEDELAIYPTVLLFLLEDYVAKLDHCLPSTAKRISSLATSQQAASTASVGYANLDRIATPLIAHRAVKLLTFILRKLDATAEYCKVNSLTILMTV